MKVGLRREGGIAVDDPTIDTVLRSRCAEMRVAAAILDPAEQKGSAVAEQRCAGIEHGMCRIRPIVRAEDWVRRMSLEKDGVAATQWNTLKPREGAIRWMCPLAAPAVGARMLDEMPSAARISRSAMRNESVASAP